LKVIGVIFLILILIVACIAIYLYYFYVFETIRVCVGEGIDTSIICSDKDFCLEVADIASVYSDPQFNNLPQFAKESFNDVLNNVVYCEKTCFVKDVKMGIDSDSGLFEQLASCSEYEKEILFEIRGKEGLEIIKFMKEYNS